MLDPCLFSGSVGEYRTLAMDRRAFVVSYPESRHLMTERPRLYPVDSRFEDRLWQAAAPQLSQLHQEMLRLEAWIERRKDRQKARAGRVRLRMR